MKRAPVVISVALVACLVGAIGEWSQWHPIAAAQQELDSYDSRNGKKEAEEDIARGNPKWKVLGRVSDAEEHAARLKQLGIELDWFADCFVTEGIVRYRYDYNSTVRAHFVRLVGEEITRDVIGLPPVDDRQKTG